MSAPIPAFDEVIHPSHRLRLCSLLAAADSVAFTTAREHLELSDSALSKQIKILNEAGYVTVTKTPRNPHQRTWLALTTKGRRALDAHLAELTRLAAHSTVSDVDLSFGDAGTAPTSDHGAVPVRE